MSYKAIPVEIFAHILDRHTTRENFAGRIKVEQNKKGVQTLHELVGPEPFVLKLFGRAIKLDIRRWRPLARVVVPPEYILQNRVEGNTKWISPLTATMFEFCDETKIFFNWDRKGKIGENLNPTLLEPEAFLDVA